MAEDAHPLKRKPADPVPAPGLAAGRPSDKLAKAQSDKKKSAPVVKGEKERVTAYLDPDDYEKLMLFCVERKVKISGGVALLVQEADVSKYKLKS